MFVSSILLCFVFKFLSKFSYACIVIVIETVIVGKENKEGLKTTTSTSINTQDYRIYSICRHLQLVHNVSNVSNVKLPTIEAIVDTYTHCTIVFTAI